MIAYAMFPLFCSVFVVIEVNFIAIFSAAYTFLSCYYDMSYATHFIAGNSLGGSALDWPIVCPVGDYDPY